MIVDEYSRIPVVEVIPSTSAEIVVPVNRLFSLFGYPEIVKTKQPSLQPEAEKHITEETDLILVGSP